MFVFIGDNGDYVFEFKVRFMGYYCILFVYGLDKNSS